MSRPSTIDLTAPRTIGGVLKSTWTVWRSRPAVFVLIAIAIVLPFEIVLTGVLGGGFSDRYGEASETWALVDGALIGLVCAPLISATHARAVVLLATGEPTTTGQVLRAGLATLVTVILAVIFLTIITIGGTLLLIIPGIWVATVGVFTAQVKALTGTPVVESFSSSKDVVGKVGWWRTFGSIVLVSVIAGIVTTLLAVIVGVAVEVIDDVSVSGPIAVIGVALLTAATYSWTALATTLQYFAWRSRAGDPWGAPAQQDPELERGADWVPAGHTAADLG